MRDEKVESRTVNNVFKKLIKDIMEVIKGLETPEMF